MPYANDETPALGDYDKNDLEQPGTVTRLRTASNGNDFVSIRWDDGSVDSPLKPGLYADFKTKNVAAMK